MFDGPTRAFGVAAAWGTLPGLTGVRALLLQVRMAFDWAYCQLVAPADPSASLLHRIIRWAAWAPRLLVGPRLLAVSSVRTHSPLCGHTRPSSCWSACALCCRLDPVLFLRAPPPHDDPEPPPAAGPSRSERKRQRRREAEAAEEEEEERQRRRQDDRRGKKKRRHRERSLSDGEDARGGGGSGDRWGMDEDDEAEEEQRRKKHKHRHHHRDREERDADEKRHRTGHQIGSQNGRHAQKQQHSRSGAASGSSRHVYFD